MNMGPEMTQTVNLIKRTLKDHFIDFISYVQKARGKIEQNQTS